VAWVQIFVVAAVAVGMVAFAWIVQLEAYHELDLVVVVMTFVMLAAVIAATAVVVAV